MLTVDEVRAQGTATEEQREQLRALLKERAVDAGWVETFFDKVRKAEGLSRLAASDALTYLHSLAPAGEHPDRAIPAQAEAMRYLRLNRVLPANVVRRMLKLYTDGGLTYDRADQIIREWLRMPHRDHAFLEGGPVLADQAPDGYFGLIATDGTPRCYRIHTMPGSRTRVVQQITGERAGQRRQLRADAAAQIMHEVAADVPAAARLYGETRNHCSNCNQPLRDTTQPGYPHGYGRDCWEALQALHQQAAPTGQEN